MEYTGIDFNQGEMILKNREIIAVNKKPFHSIENFVIPEYYGIILEASESFKGASRQEFTDRVLADNKELFINQVERLGKMKQARGL